MNPILISILADGDFAVTDKSKHKMSMRNWYTVWLNPDGTTSIS